MKKTYILCLVLFLCGCATKSNIISYDTALSEENPNPITFQHI